jgi:predicted Zn-dependent peptidase
MGEQPMTDGNRKSGGFEIVTDPILGEEVWIGRTSKGLRLRVIPTDRFQEVAAAIAFRYGSTDLGFARNGDEVHTPEGMAHYLEHKLFEDDAIKAFDRFARRGAQVNAMTGYTRTAYYFTASSEVEENLQDLLHLVSNAHITAENVDKERGIIAQELRMYEDSPDFRNMLDMLELLFPKHPVRHSVGGTVESIQGITAEGLLECYSAFYRTGNAALAVAGPVDPEKLLAVAESCALQPGEPARSLCPEDLGPAEDGPARRTMQVARNKVLLGFKDRVLLADAETRLRRDLVTRVLLDRLFASSSEIRERMDREGLVDDSLGYFYTGDRNFGFTAIGGETEEPDQLIQALKDVLLTAVELDEDHLERVRRKFLGQYLRSFESVKQMAFGNCQEELEGVPPFKALERMQSIGIDEVRARQEEHFTTDSLGVAVTTAEGAGS